MSTSSTLAADLRRVAANYVWTWDVEIRDTLRVLLVDWNGGHPYTVAAALDDRSVDALAADPRVAERLRRAARRVEALEAASCALGSPDAPMAIDTAYISAEFGISETLPQYSGGLGILSGDHLKAASDLGLGLVGVGLFYANGYFNQGLDAGGQVVDYDTYQPADLGLVDTRVTIGVETPRGTVLARAWLARVGSVRLYLLDARVDGNPPWAAAVTDRLYGGDQQHRVDQEMLLGVGGWRALAALGLAPAMVHLNEGHAGFCLLEMMADAMARGDSFPQARRNVRSRTLFTTHTPVPAGIDRFPRNLLEPYLRRWSERTGVGVDTVWAEGQLPSDASPDQFNMAAFCLGHAAVTNGVSALHGEVSQGLFGSHPEGANITSVTNGVHARTWTDPVAQRFFDRHLGADSGWHNGDLRAWSRAADLPADEIVGLRAEVRGSLIDWLNTEHGTTLDPDVLTIGFARRFATYKRAALLLRRPERMARLLADDDRPVQFVFAGKAHPADRPGQAILRDIVGYGATDEANGRFVFVPGYDMAMAGRLYAGCDVWLNTPVRPQEACGTSGEKAALNGGINCSILDGWWAEWFDPSNGWAIPVSDQVDPERRDDDEAVALHSMLADEIVPTFYGDGTSGPSEAWVDRIRAGWRLLGPKVTAGRMVAEYHERFYRPIVDGTLRSSFSGRS